MSHRAWPGTFSLSDERNENIAEETQFQTELGDNHTPLYPLSKYLLCPGPGQESREPFLSPTDLTFLRDPAEPEKLRRSRPPVPARSSPRNGHVLCPGVKEVQEVQRSTRVIIKHLLFCFVLAMKLRYATQKGEGEADQFLSKTVFVHLCLGQIIFLKPDGPKSSTLFTER